MSKKKMFDRFLGNFYEKLLAVTLAVYIPVQACLAKLQAPAADEGMHAFLGLFYRDAFLRFPLSLSEAWNFFVNYIVQYPKVSAFYPPLYHFLIGFVSLVHESIDAFMMVNVFVVAVTSIIVYKIAEEILGKKKFAYFSSLGFLGFTTIFYYATAIMVDLLQILTFSAVVLFYLKMRTKKTGKKEIIILAFLLFLSYLTKYYSIFLLPLLLIGGWKDDKLNLTIPAILTSFLFVSPYAFFHWRTGLLSVLLAKAGNPWDSNLVYFNTFRNFGWSLGFLMVPSILYFLYKKRDLFYYVWLFLPLSIFLFMNNNIIRSNFIFYPLYAVSLGFFWMKFGGKKLFSKIRLEHIFICLIILQFGLNVMNGLHVEGSSSKELIEGVDGNVLLAGTRPITVGNAVINFRLKDTPYSFYKDCIFETGEFNQSFVKRWKIKYVINQVNTTSGKKMFSKEEIKKYEWKPVETYQNITLYDTGIEKEVSNCNYICAVHLKICRNDTMSETLERVREAKKY